MAAHIDQINTGSVTRSADGFEAEVSCLVTDVQGDNWSRRFNALRAPGLPQYGDQHPHEPTLSLSELQVESVKDTPTSFIVRLIYRALGASGARPLSGDYGPTQWSGDVTTYTEETTHDINGRLLIASYAGTPTRQVYDASTGSIIETFTLNELGLPVRRIVLVEGQKASVDRPTIVWRAARWERNEPILNSELVTAHTNSQAFRGKPVGTVFGQGVTYEAAEDAGFDVRYTFAYRPQGWQFNASVVWQGSVPDDATIGNGIHLYDVYESSNFNNLRL